MKTEVKILQYNDRWHEGIHELNICYISEHFAFHFSDLASVPGNAFQGSQNELFCIFVGGLEAELIK
jgi:hypothetical protein